MHTTNSIGQTPGWLAGLLGWIGLRRAEPAAPPSSPQPPPPLPLPPPSLARPSARKPHLVALPGRSPLSQEELELVVLLASGLDLQAIADVLHASYPEVAERFTALQARLGWLDRTEIVAEALRRNWIRFA